MMPIKTLSALACLLALAIYANSVGTRVVAVTEAWPVPEPRQDDYTYTITGNTIELSSDTGATLTLDNSDVVTCDANGQCDDGSYQPMPDQVLTSAPALQR